MVSPRSTVALLPAIFVLAISTMSEVKSAPKEDSRVYAISPVCAAPEETVTLTGRGFGAQNVDVKVGDAFAEVLHASGHSIEFVVPFAAPAGFTSVTTTNPGGQSGVIEFQVKGSEICANGVDDDCDGKVDEVEECPVTSITIDSSTDFLTLLQGESANVVTVISIENETGEFQTVLNTESIEPDDGGVTLLTDFPPGGFTSDVSTAFVVNQSFEGLTPGSYTFTNEVSIAGTDITAEAPISIVVLPPAGDPEILPLGSDPDSIEVGVPTEAIFTVTVANYLSPPSSILLRNFDGANNPVVGEMLDDGQGADLAAGDGVFSGTFEITAPVEGPLNFIASALFPGVSEEQNSSIFAVQATTCPVGIHPIDETKIISDAAYLDPFACNEVIVNLSDAKNATCAEIQALGELVGGTVVGTGLGLGLVQIDLPNPGCTFAPVADAVWALNGAPGVAKVSPHFVGTVTTAVTPNDTRYSSQTAPQQMRTDEAWVLERGGPAIAIVDSGVNDAHEDLAGKVINGHDFVAGDSDPDDEGDHGTHVAGIAAASTDNGRGIAGISWKSKILAIRGIGGTYSALALAIKQAADRGAKVINISGGGLSNETSVKDAVDYATGKGSLVISTPANLSQVSAGGNFYPGAYSNVFCVGATNASDGRSTSSNYADYVDIAAPGDNVLSLLSGGGYGTKTGVSMAAPHVAGIAALVWSRYPAWSAAQVRDRIEKTSLPLAESLNIGVGRVDAFEAVFNGSFEDGIRGWTAHGSAGSIENLGPISKRDRKKMAFASSGPDTAQVQTSIVQNFTVQPDVTSIPIKFFYNLVTEEYPEFVGTVFNDNVRIILMTPSGGEVELAYEDVNSSAFTPVNGIDFPGGDNTVGQTGWKEVAIDVPVTAGETGSYSIVVRDEGDGIYDSNLLIDHIRFE